ncbi:oxidoreductase [Fomes fomentarius]|nr:oxidoreductase [Fomes fomentarius]
MTSFAMPWSDGELAMQQLLPSARRDYNPTTTFLSTQAATMLARAPLLAAHPWVTVWGGEPGFAQPLANSIMVVRASIDRRYDPVAQALVNSKAEGEIVKDEGVGRMIGGLTFDLVTRKRVKLYGRMVVASLGRSKTKDGIMQLVVRIEQSLGNCPKYLNSKIITPVAPQPKLASTSPVLTTEAHALINKADMFFIASHNANHDMDVNYRGGLAGFVRIVPSSPTTLVYPEYSGNRLYQTLGNLHNNPKAGFCFLDFTTGDVLYLTGTTKVHIGRAAADLLPHSNVAVSFAVTGARFVRRGLPFRGKPVESSDQGVSPYNPPVWCLAAEGSLLSQTVQAPRVAVTLTSKELITPTVARFTFTLDRPARIVPGQWVALDASEELYQGYSHMRDDDPKSLNDDIVRTFTVTGASGWHVPFSTSFDIMVRRKGPVTGRLFASSARAPPALRVVGFGGDFRVSSSPGRGEAWGAACTVGVTPLLAALFGGMLEPASIALFWTLGVVDAALVGDVFEQYPALADKARVFLTGRDGRLRVGAEGGVVQRLRSKSVAVELRRMVKADLVDGVESDRWYLCAGARLKEDLLGWLNGKGEILYENFDY